MWLYFGIVVLCVQVGAMRFSSQNIHLDMNLDELAHIFGVDSHEHVPKYEVIYLKMKRNVDEFQSPKGSKRDSDAVHAGKFSYSFKAFGQDIKLDLEKNHVLMSKNMNITQVTSGGDLPMQIPSRNCHYLSKSGDNIAAISHCNGPHKGLHGLILTPSHPIEISPVPERLRNGSDESVPHILKVPKQNSNLTFTDDEQNLNASNNSVMEDVAGDEIGDIVSKRGSSGINLELSVYFDTSAYKKYYNYFRDDSYIVDMILGYINQVQTMYLLKSLGRPITITIVHLELQKTVPPNSGLSTQDAVKLLNHFSVYQRKHASDMSLLLSGFDYWMLDPKTKKKSSVVMGLAPVNGVCNKASKGVIAEIGVTNDLGKLFPSAGWTSAYVTAHEIAHNLGMSHDGLGNTCPTEGFIMSPSRGTKGETTWSACSAKVLSKITPQTKSCLFNSPKPSKWNHMKYKNEPGQFWDSNSQCQTLLKTHEAWRDQKQDISEICTRLKCRANGKYGYYSSGPALTGTYCGGNNWCQGGKCVAANRKLTVITPNWGSWKLGKLQSGCIEKSKSAMSDIRYCEKPASMNVVGWCKGSTRRTRLSSKKSPCSKTISSEKFASKQCSIFKNHLSDLTIVGRQLPYSTRRPSYFACAIACKLKSGSWYTPMIEFNDMPNISTFFPEGTWCHNDGKQNYYCQNNNCLPENQRSGKSFSQNIKDGLEKFANNNGRKSKDLLNKMKTYMEFVPDDKDGGLIPRINQAPEMPESIYDDIDVDDTAKSV